MVVVHGLVTADGDIACWAEATSSGPAGRRTSLRRAVPHPFAASPPIVGASGSAVLHLPTAGSSPLGSPELGRTSKTRGAVRMLPWTVPIVVPGLAADLEDASDHTVGSSIGWVADVRRLARHLVQRGRVVPAIVKDEAGWRAVLAGPDEARLELLWRAMPGVARAATPGVDAATATRLALDVAADAIVRGILTEPLIGPGDGLVREWLTGLSGPRRSLHGALTGTERSRQGDGPAVSARSRQGDGLTRLSGPRRAPPGGGLTDPERPRQGGGPTGSERPRPDEVEALKRRLDHWADSGRPAPVRTCFRLGYDDEDGWGLEFLLQPADEPSLLVSAAHVWRDMASPLMRWVDDPAAILLADLGRACRLYPDLEEVLRSPYPAEQRLDLAGAYRFLTHASVLEDAGFGVLVPSVWQRRQDLGLTLTVRTPQPAAPVLRDNTANRDAIVKYRWGLALGREFLSEEDLIELARAKVPLVRLRGRWVHLDRDRLRTGPRVPGPRRNRGDDGR